MRLFVRVLLCGISGAAATAAQAAPSSPVQQAGFEVTRLVDGTEVGIWFPTIGTPVEQRLGLYAQSIVKDAVPVGSSLPLVVISHGSGSSFAGHSHTAVALARAGFIVAVPTHKGDNWRDQSRSTELADRPQALSATITYMLGNWHHSASINPGRIGAFGFSAGGFTVLAAAGGKPDLSRIAPHCAAHPTFFECTLTRNHPPATLSAWGNSQDARIKAIVVAAPAIGYSFGQAGLKAIRLPVQLWRAGNDQVIPAPFYADAVRAALPRKPDWRDVPGGGHFDFMASCVPGGPPLPICDSAAGFDRAAFHQRFHAEIVRFFRTKL